MKKMKMKKNNYEVLEKLVIEHSEIERQLRPQIKTMLQKIYFFGK